MDADEKQRLTYHFDYGFRELQLRDIVRSAETDVDIRMGTFIQCAAFIDALALAYSGTLKGGSAKKWGRFVKRYFPAEYASVVTYKGFRCLLLHNFSADLTLGFIHEHPEMHLCPRLGDGRIMLDRGPFVADVAQAFERFQRDVFADDALGQRVLAWLEDGHQPLAFSPPSPRP